MELEKYCSKYFKMLFKVLKLQKKTSNTEKVELLKVIAWKRSGIFHD
jgi:hypothetical protein